MRLGKTILVIICIAALLTSTTSAFAVSTTTQNNVKGQMFSDVPPGYWAYDAINAMAQRGIIEGNGNGLFDPNAEVTRGQFSKMMVLTLDLELREPENPTFMDLNRDSWAYKYVETAKYYLTGFRTSDGDYFRPNESAVREDMAVSLVKALGYAKESVNEGVLDAYYDSDAISPNLKKYVAIAVSKGVMEGSELKNGKMAFAPQDPLTRASAAALLYRIINNGKVTYDDEKVTYDEEEPVPDDDGDVYEKVTVTGSVEKGVLVLRWNKISDNRLQGYKVVISKENPCPKYPDDGYLYYITDKNRNYAVIDNSTAYNGGDFGGYLEKGESYYFSITALYDDIVLPGNVIKAVYPGDKETQHTVPVVKGGVGSRSVTLKWNKINDEGFQGYKVVISQNNPKPKYPDDGYLYYITDRNQTTAIVDNSCKYNGGDFGGYLVPGQKYYFSITALYDDKQVPGNVISLKFPGESKVIVPETGAAKVTGKVEGNKIILKWNRIDSESFQGYKVVISKSNPKPKYPDDGYLYYITDRNQTTATVDDSCGYNGGDFGGRLEPGKAYYFSITVLYTDKKVAGNAIRMTYPG